jgi:hypothetical protein
MVHKGIEFFSVYNAFPHPFLLGECRLLSWILVQIDMALGKNVMVLWYNMANFLFPVSVEPERKVTISNLMNMGNLLDSMILLDATSTWISLLWDLPRMVSFVH